MTCVLDKRIKVRFLLDWVNKVPNKSDSVHLETHRDHAGDIIQRVLPVEMSEIDEKLKGKRSSRLVPLQRLHMQQMNHSSAPSCIYQHRKTHSPPLCGGNINWSYPLAKYKQYNSTYTEDSENIYLQFKKSAKRQKYVGDLGENCDGFKFAFTSFPLKACNYKIFKPILL